MIHASDHEYSKWKLQTKPIDKSTVIEHADDITFGINGIDAKSKFDCFEEQTNSADC